MAISSVILILTIAGAVVTAQENVCSTFCSSLGMLQSSPGKSCTDIYQINKASRGVSGLYWINTTSGLHQVNCDMELECGGHKGGWTTIVKLDTSKGDSCPSGWSKITTPGDLPKVVYRSGNDAGGCYSAIFTTYNITFNKICGQVKGYQKGNPNAFSSTKSINKYVDGLSITLVILASMCGHMQWESVMIIILQIIIVPVLLYLDEIHLLLLAITTTVSLDIILVVHTIRQTCCGMDMVVIMLIITAVPTLICLGSSDNFHYPLKIILKQGFVAILLLVMKILLWRVLNCTYNEIEDAFTTVSYSALCYTDFSSICL